MSLRSFAEKVDNLVPMRSVVLNRRSQNWKKILIFWTKNVKYRKMQQNREDEKRALEASNRELRRKITEMEKKLADVTMLLEEERKNTENFQWQLERKNTRNRFLRRELDAAEEEASRERSKVRKLQREVEDLTEANEAFLRLTSMRM
ncbi:hypothetical protein QR680_002187 [Steinernema hermaphroditum]|uniref:Myosin tail domain-containing protein n=1 Tax=Steinernema hermaphroditum TaxID=289476 RepID=A0AA39H4G5_9BILA|nr:hypothetical protein QR680_002187 [Steinernema hermaphroditum]